MLSNLSTIQYFVLPQYYYIANNNNYKINIIKYDEMEKLNDILQLNLTFNGRSHNNLTKSQKNKIYNIYKIDFEKFGFDHEEDNTQNMSIYTKKRGFDKWGAPVEDDDEY